MVALISFRPFLIGISKQNTMWYRSSKHTLRKEISRYCHSISLIFKIWFIPFWAHCNSMLFTTRNTQFLKTESICYWVCSTCDAIYFSFEMTMIHTLFIPELNFTKRNPITVFRTIRRRPSMIFTYRTPCLFLFFLQCSPAKLLLQATRWWMEKQSSGKASCHATNYW